MAQNDTQDSGTSVAIPGTPAPKKYINVTLPFDPLTLLTVPKCKDEDLQKRTSMAAKLTSLSLVTSFVTEHYFCVGMLPPGEDHTHAEVQQFTQSLCIYLQHFGVSNEGGLRAIVPRVLDTTEVVDGIA